jgi:pyruvate-formate lyase-activating enzyme
MINGEKLSNCDFCYREEALSKRSKRNKENDRYKDLIEKRSSFAKINQGKLEELPINLDLRLGNLCNLKCISCNPVFSSQIEQEMKTKWPESFFLKKEYSNIKIENSWFSSVEFKRNLAELLPHLEFIYVSGGEPVINKSLIDFMRDSVKLGYSKKQKLRFNTNLMIINDDFFSLLENFEEVDVSVSLDAIGEDLKIIRYPSSFEKIAKNIESILMLNGNIKLTINCTVSLLNALSLKDLYHWVADLSGKHKTYIHISVDLVHEPVFLSLPYLDKTLKSKGIAEISDIENIGYLKGAALADLLSLKDNIVLEPQDRDIQKNKLIEYIKILEKSRSIPIFKKLKSLTGLLNG